MAATGWPAEAIAFYEDLEANNTKTWWQANKATYDECVRAPMDALLADLEAKGYGAGKVFRPNRDIRFSADKSPYKINIAASTEKGPYIGLSADGFDLGRGYYMMAKDQLAAYRAAVADDETGMALEEIVTTLTKAGIEVTAHDSLKTAPRGYPKDHPRIELLRHKGLIAWKHHPPAKWLATKAVLTKTVAFTEASQPLVDWLDRHVGASELESGWG